MWILYIISSNGLFFAEKTRYNFKSFKFHAWCFIKCDFSLRLLGIRKNYGIIYSLIITHLSHYTFISYSIDSNFYLFQNYTKKITHKYTHKRTGIMIARANLSDIRFNIIFGSRMFTLVYTFAYSLWTWKRTPVIFCFPI